MKTLIEFLTDEQGQDMTEYIAILGAVVAVAAIVIIAFRTRLQALWQNAISNMR
ncbi:hypothetical protein [Thermanaerothrix sp.]|uniref:hypothetical protein n=1 Tax=Thermanaerothrix sp. TaxID=2972675 RepID=UPI002ADDC112|nr:hypothetical protein [Thermanaerothrix sp.]